MILSIDLAARDYQDNGIILLSGRINDSKILSIKPKALGLIGTPIAAAFADAICDVAEQHGVKLIVLDGPQGWRAEASSVLHSRICERDTRTPGKTGLPGSVKPRSWSRMVTFSIELFDTLAAAGWPRYDGSQTNRTSIESFPTHAWRCVGQKPLPSKRQRPDTKPWQRFLESAANRHVAPLSHDELQAAVAGLAGLQLLQSPDNVRDAQGVKPKMENGLWREGLIVSPRLPRAGKRHASPAT